MSRVLDEYLQGTSGAVEFWKSSLLDIYKKKKEKKKLYSPAQPPISWEHQK